MSKVICIYHGGCADGFCAAWVFRNHGGYIPEGIEFIPAFYGDPPPDCTGKRVYVLDFSYPRDQLITMSEQADFIKVLDHHKTAEESLRGLDFCVFDMDRSGARMAWDYFVAHEHLPWLVRYVEDRDLWRWALPDSRAINACLRSFPMTFEEWDRINEFSIGLMIAGGEAILRDQQMTVDIKVKQSHLVEIPLNDFPEGCQNRWRCANATTLVSETAGELAKETGIGCCWFEDQYGNRIYSLRTTKEHNIDCSEIARFFGGGGHPGAAGFKVFAGSPHPWSTT